MLWRFFKYFTLFLVLGWLLCAIDLYMVMQPIALHPKDMLLPIVAVAFFALFPAYLETKLQQRNEELLLQRNQRREIHTNGNEVKTSQLKMDSLTNAISKDAFNEIIGLKIIESKHLDHPLSMILFDIDFFKKINDTYGHLTGDVILKELAQTVKGNLREAEYFVRWGGEEFIVLLPGTSIQGAKMVAEKLRRTIEHTPFEKVGKVTCSFGVTALKIDDTIKSFLSRADEALYEAKEAGRNRVRVKI